jgi:endonuclease/exonuclease/phosphatase family metal-dependent hydrolase
MSAPPLHITTFNIHKGFSQFNRRMMVHELRERLRQLNPDIVFLQEVQGLHLGHAERHGNWPAGAQHEFLAEDIWQASAYGCNMIYDRGHHGNAILSRFPILHSHNQDVTHLHFEKRGLLHCRIELPAGDFNDWSNRAGKLLEQSLGMREVFCNLGGPPVRSFPAAIPMFRLDRIYVRGFTVSSCAVHHGLPWSQISDHAALSAHLARYGN